MPSVGTDAEKTGLPREAVYALRAPASAENTTPLYAAPSVPTTLNETAELALQWPGVDDVVGVGVDDGVSVDVVGVAVAMAPEVHATVPTAVLVPSAEWK